MLFTPNPPPAPKLSGDDRDLGLAAAGIARIAKAKAKTTQAACRIIRPLAISFVLFFFFWVSGEKEKTEQKI
jgi:hypothetical protein